jgi:predicted DNA-binding protein with PD1-like motif
LVQLENGQDANLNLVTLFKSLGIQVTVACMNVMDELATALIKMYSQEYERSLLPPSHSRARI